MAQYHITGGKFDTADSHEDGGATWMAAAGSMVGMGVTTEAGVGKVDTDAADVHEEEGEIWMAAAGGGVDVGVTTETCAPLTLGGKWLVERKFGWMLIIAKLN